MFQRQTIYKCELIKWIFLQNESDSLIIEILAVITAAHFTFFFLLMFYGRK